jgi:phosphoglycolate phosphatase-like HAD superfamily hydrolase
MREIEAVLFDNDGTLTNSSSYVLKSFESTLQLHGLQAKSKEEIYKVIG